MKRIRCINCHTVFPMQGSLMCCPYCSKKYTFSDGLLCYESESVLKKNFPEKFLLFKTLSTNSYLCYLTMKEQSLAVSGRQDVDDFSSFLKKWTVPGTLLDIGCGMFQPPSYLSGIKNLELYGIDPVSDRAFCQIGTRVCGYAEFLPFEDSCFDNLIFATSLDHVCDLDKTLSESCRVMKSGGHLIVWAGDFPLKSLKQYLTEIPTKILDYLKNGYFQGRYRSVSKDITFYVPPGAADHFHMYHPEPEFLYDKICRTGFIKKEFSRKNGSVFMVLEKEKK